MAKRKDTPPSSEEYIFNDMYDERGDLRLRLGSETREYEEENCDKTERRIENVETSQGTIYGVTDLMHYEPVSQLFDRDLNWESGRLFRRLKFQTQAMIFLEGLVLVRAQVDPFPSPRHIVLLGVLVVRNWICCWSASRHNRASLSNSKV
jgi:hypothetical protein